MIFGQVVQFVSPDLNAEEQARLRFDPAPSAAIFGSALLMRSADFDLAGPFDPSLRVAEFIEWYGRAQDAGIGTGGAARNRVPPAFASRQYGPARPRQSGGLCPGDEAHYRPPTAACVMALRHAGGGMTSRRLPFLPTREEELLLKGIFLDGDAAIESWTEWRKRTTVDALDFSFAEAASPALQSTERAGRRASRYRAVQKRCPIPLDGKPASSSPGGASAGPVERASKRTCFCWAAVRWSICTIRNLGLRAGGQFLSPGAVDIGDRGVFPDSRPRDGNRHRMRKTRRYGRASSSSTGSCMTSSPACSVMCCATAIRNYPDERFWGRPRTISIQGRLRADLGRYQSILLRMRARHRPGCNLGAALGGRRARDPSRRAGRLAPSPEPGFRSADWFGDFGTHWPTSRRPLRSPFRIPSSPSSRPRRFRSPTGSRRS